jgi:hypothetical protein
MEATGETILLVARHMASSTTGATVDLVACYGWSSIGGRRQLPRDAPAQNGAKGLQDRSDILKGRVRGDQPPAVTPFNRQTVNTSYVGCEV